MLVLKVSKVTMVAPRIKQIILEGTDVPLPKFSPGAHIKINIPGDEVREYSLVCLDPNIDSDHPPLSYVLAVLLEDASKGGSSYMHGLAAGDKITCSLPKNDFLLVESENPLLIAGGIGITPITAMVSTLAGQKRQYEFHYAGRTDGALAFCSELQAIASNQMTVHFDDETSRLDLVSLLNNIDTSRHIYICGPKGMIEAVKTAAQSAGIPAENLHFELFSNASEAPDDVSFEIELSSTGATYTVPAGRTIIEVLEDAGVDLMYDCQRGDCGICQTNVLEGIPDHRDVVLSEEEKNTGDVMQICVSRAKSKRLVLEI